MHNTYDRKHWNHFRVGGIGTLDVKTCDLPSASVIIFLVEQTACPMTAAEPSHVLIHRLACAIRRVKTYGFELQLPKVWEL